MSSEKICLTVPGVILAAGFVQWVVVIFSVPGWVQYIAGFLDIAAFIFLALWMTTKHLTETYPSFIMQLPVVIISVNAKGKITYTNDLAKQIWSVDQGNIYDLDNSTNSPFYLLRQTLAGDQFDQDLSFTHNIKGLSPFFWVRTSPVVDQQGKVVGATFTAWNLSERYLQEKQFTQREKMVMIGELAAGTAHEIRNPLTSVRGLIQVLGNRFSQGDPAREHISMMLAEIDQINYIIKELLLLARRTSPNLSFASLPAILDHVLLLVEGECLGRGISIIKNYDNSLPLAVLDEDQMKQVFLHLVTNAIHAMPTGGELTVAASYISSDNVIVVTFKDTGLGIPEKNLTRIFHPFFTTRPEGTGLGLPVSFQIIDNHGGKLSVQSTVGQGSIFTVTLPLVNYDNAKTS